MALTALILGGEEVLRAYLRMLRTSAESNVYAKTGTLEGVSTLAGYAWSRDRHLLAFAIMNQGILRTRHAHAFQNKVCRILTE